MMAILHSPTLIPFTAEAFLHMQQRVTVLLQLQQEVLERLKVAREMGDLSENGAYRYAKFELGNIRRELRRLNFLLENGHVSKATQNGVIGFGNTVTLLHTATNETSQYFLVSEHESNPAESKLSLQSPLGQALIGRKSGESISLLTPRGEVQYKIVSVT